MWNEIARREYELNSFDPIPQWGNQMHVAQYMLWARQNRGWVCKKREVKDGLVVEKVLWRPRT